MARWPSSNALSASKKVPVQAAPASAPVFDHFCNAATASATSACAKRAASVSGILAPSAGTSTTSGFCTLCAGTTGTVNPCAVRTRRRTPTSVSSIGDGACASVPASSLAVVSVSVRAARPRSNTPSRTRR